MAQFAPFQGPPQPGQNCCIYVGNLDPAVTEHSLVDYFSKVGAVKNCKLVRGTGQHPHPYGFVEFAEPQSAATAIQTLNGQTFMSTEIRVNWAQGGAVGAHGNGSGRSSVSSGHHPASMMPGAMAGGPQMPLDDLTVFVGDLAPELNDASLLAAFAGYGAVDARVIQDAQTGKSRGYGFVSFRTKPEAERAIQELNGKWIGGRAVRTNWASRRGSSSSVGSQGGPVPGTSMQRRSPYENGAGHGNRGPYYAPGGAQGGRAGSAGPGSPSPQPQQPPPKLSYDVVAAQTTQYTTTVYVGGIGEGVRDAMLRESFGPFGYILDVRINRDKAYAFVRFTTHDSAARAIVAMNGATLGGRMIKCSWGRETYGNVMEGYGFYPTPQMPFYGQFNYGPAVGGGGAYPMRNVPHQLMISQQQAAMAQAQAMQQQQQQMSPQQAAAAPSQPAPPAASGAQPSAAPTQTPATQGQAPAPAPATAPEHGTGDAHGTQFQAVSGIAY